jgi:hypothetical protein
VAYGVDDAIAIPLALVEALPLTIHPGPGGQPTGSSVCPGKYVAANAVDASNVLIIITPNPIVNIFCILLL